MPGPVQIRQRIDHVEAERPDRREQFVGVDGEPLEADGRVQDMHLDAVQILQQRRPDAEAQVHQPAPVGAGPGDERGRHGLEVGHRVDLPDDVVADPQSVDGVVQAGDARAGPRHDGTLAIDQMTPIATMASATLM